MPASSCRRASDRKLEQAAALGADAGVNASNPDWAKEVVKLAGGEGPEVVLDSVGGETFARSLAIVRRGGRIVTFGATTGPVEKLELTRLFWKQLDLLGSTMGSPAEFSALLGAGLGEADPAADRPRLSARRGVGGAPIPRKRRAVREGRPRSDRLIARTGEAWGLRHPWRRATMIEETTRTSITGAFRGEFDGFGGNGGRVRDTDRPRRSAST